MADIAAPLPLEIIVDMMGIPESQTAMVFENTNVILGNAALDSVTLTAKNAWAGERVPNRVLADQPVNTAAMLLRQAADALAAHFDVVFVEGTTSAAAIDVTGGLLDVTTNAILRLRRQRRRPARLQAGPVRRRRHEPLGDPRHVESARMGRGARRSTGGR